MNGKPARTHRAIAREISRLQKARGRYQRINCMSANQAHEFAQLTAAYQALSWAVQDNAQSPSKCYAPDSFHSQDEG